MERFAILTLCFFKAAVFADDSADGLGLKAAVEAQQHAYCPYSDYPVGAALVGASGKIYTGCNVENASYGLCICAERNAVFKAVSEGEQDFTTIYIITKDGGVSCGACRQVLYEFNPKIRIVAADDALNLHCDTTLDVLLPHAFGPKNLQ